MADPPATGSPDDFGSESGLEMAVCPETVHKHGIACRVGAPSRGARLHRRLLRSHAGVPVHGKASANTVQEVSMTFGVVLPVRYQPGWSWWRKAAYYTAKSLRRQPEADDWECE